MQATHVARQDRRTMAPLMPNSSQHAVYDPLMKWSPRWWCDYMMGPHGTEISAGMAWACMHGMAQQNATTSPAAGRGCLGLSRRDRTYSSSPGACASVRALQSNIGHVSRRCGHGRDGVVTVRMQVEWWGELVPRMFKSWIECWGF